MKFYFVNEGRAVLPYAALQSAKLIVFVLGLDTVKGLGIMLLFQSEIIIKLAMFDNNLARYN